MTNDKNHQKPVPRQNATGLTTKGTLTFRTEAEIVAKMARIAATLPSQVRESLCFGSGQPELLQVVGADTRRSDVLFRACSAWYWNEFKKGEIRDTHLYDSLVRRRASFYMKARFQNEFAGMIFVGETISSKLAVDHPDQIIKTLSEVFDVSILVVDVRHFARILIRKALLDIENAPPGKYSAYTLNQMPLNLHALTTSSDGCPEWFDHDWLLKMSIAYAEILRKALLRLQGN
jgi:hypothetical protein